MLQSFCMKNANFFHAFFSKVSTYRVLKLLETRLELVSLYLSIMETCLLNM